MVAGAAGHPCLAAGLPAGRCGPTSGPAQPARAGPCLGGRRLERAAPGGSSRGGLGHGARASPVSDPCPPAGRDTTSAPPGSGPLMASSSPEASASPSSWISPASGPSSTSSWSGHMPPTGPSRGSGGSPGAPRSASGSAGSSSATSWPASPAPTLWDAPLRRPDLAREL